MVDSAVVDWTTVACPLEACPLGTGAAGGGVCNASVYSAGECSVLPERPPPACTGPSGPIHYRERGVTVPLDPPAPERPSTLGELIAAGDWARARAGAIEQQAPMDLQEALDAALDFRDELRARRYPGVRRALADLTRLLPLLTGEDGAALRVALDPQALGAAVAALDASQKITEPDELAAALSGALALNATRAEALNQQGVLLAVTGQEDRARQTLEAALEADPGHYRALTNLGNLDMEAGRYAQAEAIYRRVLLLNPDYDGGHHNLGVALRRQGRIAEGVRSIRQGQRLSLKRSKTDTDAEMKEQFARSAAMRNLRWLLLAVAALVLFLALRGGGG